MVIRRSIVELCRADHRGDGPTLDQWLANKTPHNVRTWIGNRDSHMFVADDDGAILGVAAIQSSGRIALNYVSPDARFRGVSKALMARMEAKAVELGSKRAPSKAPAPRARSTLRSATARPSPRGPASV